MFCKVRCKISLRYFCLLPYGTWEFKSFTLYSVCEKSGIRVRAQPDGREVRYRPNRRNQNFINCLIASREILMYNLTHRLQVVESSTIKKITVTDNTGLPEPTGSPASRVSDKCNRTTE